MVPTGRFPDHVQTTLPPGWRQRAEALAAARGETLSAWIRRAVRRALEAADRAERRRQAAAR